jgi:hypothetical protein
MTECLPDLPRYIRQRDNEWQGADHQNGPWRPIPAPQSGLPWKTDGPAVPESREPASVATEARPLSLDAQGVLDAFRPTSHHRRAIAAVLRHLAAAHGDPESFGAVRPELLNRMAAELEGTVQTVQEGAHD